MTIKREDHSFRGTGLSHHPLEKLSVFPLWASGVGAVDESEIKHRKGIEKSKMKRSLNIAVGEGGKGLMEMLALFTDRLKFSYLLVFFFFFEVTVVVAMVAGR